MSDTATHFQRFLQHLGRGGKYQYFHTLPAGRSYWFEVGKPTALPLLPNQNAYFSVHPVNEIPSTNARGEPKEPEYIRSRIAFIAAINCLYAEFDKDKGANHKIIESLNPAPSIVILSGGGWHVYWLLAEPYLLPTEADRSRAARIQAKWVSFMRSDPGAKDLARILRPPGTYNFKYKPPLPVDFSESHFDRLFTLDDLIEKMNGIYHIEAEPDEQQPTTIVQDLGDRVIDQFGIERVHPAAHFLSKYANEQRVGNRNEKGFQLALQLRDSGLTETQAEQVVVEYANRVEQGSGHSAYTVSEARSSVHSAFSRPPRDPATLPRISKNGNNGHWRKRNDELPAAEVQDAVTEKPDQPGLNDVGNGQRLARLFADRIRHVADWGWLVWNGKYWEKDITGEVMRLAKTTARRIFIEAAQASDDKEAKEIAHWANVSHGKSRLDAMISLAASEPPVPARVEAFDADPMLLNVQNGLLDLATGQLFPHSSSALVTKIANAPYELDASCPTWLQFLNTIMDGDADMIDYLARASGYALTGKLQDHALFFLYGKGANGKTTFTTAIQHVLGSYAKQAAPHLLMSGNRHPTEIADLFGARFVSISEVEEGRKMAEGLVKWLTGGDQIKGRFMHKDFFDIPPTFKFFLSANHKPVITGTDDGIWRRIQLIPFLVTIPEGRRDPRLPEKLRTEAPGILRWLVDGCRRYQERGLDLPKRVRQATNEYRAEMDVLGNFIAECCVVNSLASVKSKALYEAYQKWAIENGLDVMSHIAFSQKMKDRGFVRGERQSYGYPILGIGLLTNEGGEEQVS